MSDALKPSVPETTKLNSGWRPYSGWVVCVWATGYALIGYPVLSWAATLLGVWLNRIVPGPPQLDTTLFLEIFLILIGYRTIEKVKEVATK